MKLAPLGFWAAAAHTGAVYAMSAGAVSFGQIVKAAEPAFAVVVGYTVYGKLESKAKIAMLIPIIGGIMIASAQELTLTLTLTVTLTLTLSHPHPHPHPNPNPSPNQELDFTVGALVAGCTANVASAFRGQESKSALTH